MDRTKTIAVFLGLYTLKIAKMQHLVLEGMNAARVKLVSTILLVQHFSVILLPLAQTSIISVGQIGIRWSMIVRTLPLVLREMSGKYGSR